jgi:hypothetical protein
MPIKRHIIPIEIAITPIGTGLDKVINPQIINAIPTNNNVTEMMMFTLPPPISSRTRDYSVRNNS